MAVLGVLAACTRGGEPPPLPVNPTPTAPGQVVVLAGNGEQKRPVDGALATRSPVYASGAIAAAPDGSIFTFADNGANRTLVRIGGDGRVHVLPVLTSLGGRVVLAATRAGVWSMDTGGQSSLTRTALDGSGKTVVFGPAAGGPGSLTFVDATGHALPDAQARALVRRWKPSAMAVRDDGIPVVATEDGSLYEALGQGKVRPWNPPGYAAAVEQARLTGPANDNRYELDPTVILSEPVGGLVIAGQGIIRLPAHGKATATRLRVATAGFRSWGGGALLNDGSLLLGDNSINGAASPQRLLRVTSNGDMFELPLAKANSCAIANALDRISIVGALSGPTRLSNGTLAVIGCHRMLGVRWPGPQAERPFS